MPEWFGGSALRPDMLIPLTEQWQPQWNCIIRWYQGVQRVKENSRQIEPTDYDLDIVITFLQNCYHLRDWISACLPDLRAKVDALFDGHF